MIGPVLFNDFAIEEKGIGIRDRAAIVSETEANTASYSFKPAAFGLKVVLAAYCLNMFVVGAAFEQQVTIGVCISGVGVVSHIVGGESVCPILNPDVTMQLIDRPIFFLAECLYGDR